MDFNYYWTELERARQAFWFATEVLWCIAVVFSVLVVWVGWYLCLGRRDRGKQS